MDTNEWARYYQLRREIATLVERVSALEKAQEALPEEIRQVLLSYGVIEGAAEDE